MNGLPLVPYKNVGDPLDTEDWNRVARIVNSLAAVTGAYPVRVTQMNNTTMIGVDESAIQQDGTIRMIVKTISNDYLTCKVLDGSSAEVGSNIYVARPRMLRHNRLTDFPLITTWTTVNAQQATISNGSTSATVKVIPSYVADVTVIWARPSVVTGVTVSDVAVTFEDTNRDARAWTVPSS